MEKDSFMQGRAKYTQKSVIMETGKVINDHQEIIYINGEYEGLDSELGRLIHDFRQNDPKQVIDRDLQLRMRDIKYGKEKGEMEQVFGSVWDEIEAKIEKQVTERVTKQLTVQIKKQLTDQIEKQDQVKMAKKLLRRGRMSIAEIAEDTELSIEEVKALQEK